MKSALRQVAPAVVYMLFYFSLMLVLILVEQPLMGRLSFMFSPFMDDGIQCSPVESQPLRNGFVFSE